MPYSPWYSAGQLAHPSAVAPPALSRRTIGSREAALTWQVVPVYYVFFTLSSIMMGFILYREFSVKTPVNLFLFFMGAPPAPSSPLPPATSVGALVTLVSAPCTH